MTIHIDDLREKSLSELIKVALTLEDPSSFWVVAGMIGGKAYEQGERGLAVELWKLSHAPLNREAEALAEARALATHYSEGDPAMSSPWTHSICWTCWHTSHPDREPVRVRNPRERQCCFCGGAHLSGIFVRQDPADTRLKCAAWHLPEGEDNELE